MTQRNRAEGLSPGFTPARRSSSIMRRLFRAWFPSSPPKEEDQTPGRPSSTSTSSPESSASRTPGMHLEAESALSVAFSVNVTPVSSTGGAWG